MCTWLRPGPRSTYVRLVKRRTLPEMKHCLGGCPASSCAPGQHEGRHGGGGDRPGRADGRPLLYEPVFVCPCLPSSVSVCRSLMPFLSLPASTPQARLYIFLSLPGRPHALCHCPVLARPLSPRPLVSAPLADNLGGDDDRRGDGYMEAYEPILASIPWLPIVGNHEFLDGDQLRRCVTPGRSTCWLLPP